MRNKQKGGVIVFSKLAITDNKSIEELINYFLQNSTLGLLTKEGAEGIILYVNLNAGVESPFVKLNNDADPFSDDVPVQQLILKINLLNPHPIQGRALGTNTYVITPFKKRTITKEAFYNQIQKEQDAFLKTFNGVESMVPTIFFYDKILKSADIWKGQIAKLFDNVDPSLTFTSSEIWKIPRHRHISHSYERVKITYNLKEELLKIISHVEGIGICFYEMIERSQTVYDYIKENKHLDLKRDVIVKIFAKMIIMLEKGIIHGDHHFSNILLDVNSNIQFIDFARSHAVILPQKIQDKLELIKTSNNEHEMSLAVINCLNFIYSCGYYDGTEITYFKPEWDMYNYIKKTIMMDATGSNIKRQELVVKVCELVRAENAKQERMSQIFLSDVIIGPSLIECEAERRFKNVTKKEELINVIKKLFDETPNENIVKLKELTIYQLKKLFVDNISENEIAKTKIIEACRTTMNVEFSMEFIQNCRQKVFESETPKYGGSAAGGGDNNYGGAKTKRRKGRQSRKGKKRNNSKTKHRKLVGGGRFDSVFTMPGIESNSPFEMSQFEKRPINKSNSYIKQSLSVSPIKTQVNWISHYYNMDFAKTQETINKCFIQHDFFAGIIIILIKLGVIGNNPPSIILKTEKAKTIITNAIEYYKKLDKILNPLHISSANGASPVAFQPRP